MPLIACEWTLRDKGPSGLMSPCNTRIWGAQCVLNEWVGYQLMVNEKSLGTIRFLFPCSHLVIHEWGPYWRKIKMEVCYHALPHYLWSPTLYSLICTLNFLLVMSLNRMYCFKSWSCTSYLHIMEVNSGSKHLSLPVSQNSIPEAKTRNGEKNVSG